MLLPRFFGRWIRRSSGPARSGRAKLQLERLEERSLLDAGLPSGIAVFDPRSAAWAARVTAAPGAPDLAPFAFGTPTTTPLAADFDGDGAASVAVADGSGV